MNSQRLFILTIYVQTAIILASYLTLSDPAHPATLFPELFGPGRAYVSYAMPGN